MGKGSKDGDAPKIFCPADYLVWSKTAANFGWNVILFDIYKAIINKAVREIIYTRETIMLGGGSQGQGALSRCPVTAQQL